MNKNAYSRLFGLNKKAAKYHVDTEIDRMGKHPEQYNWDDQVWLEDTQKYKYQLAKLFRLLRNRYGYKATPGEGLEFSFSRYVKNPSYTDFSKKKTSDIAVKDPEIIEAARNLLRKTQLGQVGISLYKEREDAQGFPRDVSGQLKDYLA